MDTRSLDDSRGEVADPSRAEGIADLDLGLAERRGDAVLHASRRGAQADEHSAIPHPLAPHEGDAEARRMRERTVRLLDDVDDDRARPVRTRLERAKPVLRHIAHHEDEARARARERG